MKIPSGLFITLEGIEGVGKSTCLKFISKYLISRHIKHFVTREPGGTPFAEQIRHLLLHHHSEENIYPDTELLLLFASRAQHIANIILPAIKNGEWVICDRFTEATYAYQGGGRGISPHKIELLEKCVQGNFRPHLVILLDAPVKKALSRTFHRKEQDRIEREKEFFFRKVRNAYLQRAQLFPDRYYIVDAGRPLSYVKNTLKIKVDQLITSWMEKHSAE